MGNKKRATLVRPLRAVALFLLISLAAGFRLPAVSYLQEGFNYAPGNLGGNPPWTNSTSLITVTNGGLSYPYLMDFSPPANTVVVSEGATVATYRPLSTPATNGAVYFSLLINFTTVPGNYYIVGLTQSTNTSFGGKTEDPLDFLDNPYSNGCSLGIRALGNSGVYFTNGSLPLSTNTTYLVVMKYNFTNGTASLYVNPPAGNTEPAVPDAMCLATNTVTDLSYVYLRVGAAAAGNFLVSALRVASTWAEVMPATNATTAYSDAAMLTAFLDSLRVNDYWLVGSSVNWLTGATNGPGPNMTIGTDSHCSAYAGAVTDLLGIYLLRQPYASDINLANNQAGWLPTNNYGWYSIASMTAAQHLANIGGLVVASYSNSAGSGHIAVLRPSNRTDANVNSFGPEECQSGDYNYADTNAVTGFSEHPGAFPNYITYWGHTVNYPVSPVTPMFSQSFNSNGMFTASVPTIVGRPYQSQWSADLTNWTPLTTFTNSNNSSSFFTNTVVTDSIMGKRFYRLLAQ